MPTSFEVVKFNVSSLLHKTLFHSEGQYLHRMMPLFLKFEKQKDPENKSDQPFITGSVIFEDQESGEILISFFQS